MCATSHMLKLATIATMASGKITRIPKTAINIPQVRKRCCQMGSIFFKIPALTTALSKDKLVSSTIKMAAVNNPAQPAHNQAK